MVNEYNFGTVTLWPMCDNKCVFCGMHDERVRSKHPDKITKEMEVNLLKNTIDLIKKGVKNLDISGSEPLKYDKIGDYIRWIRPKFRDINLLDPGVRLKDYNFAKDVVSAGLTRIIIPIYGSNSKYHDACVGREGAFDELYAGLKNLMRLKKEGYEFKLVLTTMIMQQNKDNIADLYKFTIDEFDTPLDKVSIPFYLKGKLPVNYSKFVVNFEELRRVILKLNEATLEKKRPTALHYVPPCLFTKEELKNMPYLSFFNVQYFYIFPNGEWYKHSDRDSREYRRQVYTKYCDNCELKKRGMCNGIIMHYSEDNHNFEYNPLDKETYEAIKDRIEFQAINKEVSK